MLGQQSVLPFLAIWLGIASVIAAGLVIYITIKYSPLVSRNFERQPLFLPLRLDPQELGEPIEFTTDDGFELKGSYLEGRTKAQAGIIVYCHEFLSDRWSYFPYLDHLRDLGFDIFTFDFRNHGESDSEPGFQPMQWTSDREVRDLKAALKALRVAA